MMHLSQYFQPSCTKRRRLKENMTSCQIQGGLSKTEKKSSWYYLPKRRGKSNDLRCQQRELDWTSEGVRGCFLTATTKHWWDGSGRLRSLHHQMLVRAGWTNPCQEWHTCGWRKWWDYTLCSTEPPVLFTAKGGSQDAAESAHPQVVIKHPLSFLLRSTCRSRSTQWVLRDWPVLRTTLLKIPPFLTGL